MNTISSFVIFNDFDFIFLSMSCLFESIKLFFFSKNKIKMGKKKKEGMGLVVSVSDLLKRSP